MPEVTIEDNKSYDVESPVVPRMASVSVDKVEGLPDDFVFGCDVSSLISEEKSGVVYYNFAGEKEDLLKILADNGVNTIRVRVWNDPYDAEGFGYGGGNCDVTNAILIGKRATEYGMGVHIDFHYSDFWSDPGKQMVPKAWEAMSIEEKETAVYDFTTESLDLILAAGVNVTMVQVGNEITSGMSGEKNKTNVARLLKQGSKAIRELSEKYKKEILVAVHYTNPEKKTYSGYASTLATNEVDYDVFVSSYYPYWHGTLENLTSELSKIATKYNKKVMVGVISYAYTFADGDGSANNINEGAWGEFNYEISEQGQVNSVRDCVEAVLAVGSQGIGVCYWEPAWLPVPFSAEESRYMRWQKYGSGWASYFAGSYDPNDAGKYYGGSGWDNQALFDFSGHPLESLKMFNMMRGK